MESFVREYLGSARIQSGVIHICDAQRLAGGHLDAIRGAKTLEGFVQTTTDLFVGTFFDEGRYSVFGRRNEAGELISIEILLDEVES